jgi:hypothetical protein
MQHFGALVHLYIKSPKNNTNFTAKKEYEKICQSPIGYARPIADDVEL